MDEQTTPWIEELLSFWFGALSDETKLDREVDPFRTHMQRWYGKEPDVDRQIRERFEPTLRSVTRSAESWALAEQATSGHVRSQLALTLLVDQLPRNMYRDTQRMYGYDGLGLVHAYRALPALRDGSLTLLERCSRSCQSLAF